MHNKLSDPLLFMAIRNYRYVRLLHWNKLGVNLVSIDYNDIGIGELMTLSYHSHLSTSCLVSVYMSVYQYQRLWTIFSLLKLNLYLNPFQVICHQSNLHVLGTNSKAMLLLIFYLGRGGLGFIERL